MRPFVVGLIGSIGAGKSTVAGLLACGGAAVVDADALGHQALIDLRDEVVARFGPGVLEGEWVSRSKLAAVVFGDPDRRRQLEALVHPHIRRLAAERVAASDARLVVLDAALLLEAGWDALCDAVVLVDAPRGQRLERVRERSGWTDADLAAREAAQLPLTAKRRRANHVIENTSTPEHLGRQVGGLLERWAADEGVRR